MRFIGIDEVGMSAIAGPVVVAGVVHTPELSTIDDLNDSKLLKPEKRLLIAKKILDLKVDYSIVACWNLEDHTLVDAMFRGARIILEELNANESDIILIDGKNDPRRYYPRRDRDLAAFFNRFVIRAQPKGDQLYLCVMAASILAKVFRDHLMQALSCIWPYYDWHSNVGYYSRKHYEGIQRKGLCEIHRKRIIKHRFKDMTNVIS